jgi:hypothetical protein
MRQGRRIWREPRSPETRAYTVRLLCVVCTERCVTQVPEFGYDERKGVGVCDRGPSGLGREGARDDLFPALRKKRINGSAQAVFAFT